MTILRPFPFLKHLDKLRPHNPLIMAIICHWHTIIAIGQSAPPVRFTARRWWQNNMERIADMMRQRAILSSSGDVMAVIKFFRKLLGGDGVRRSAAMEFKHGHFFLRYADSIPHGLQSSFELLGCRNWNWVTVCVHKL